MLSNFNLMSLKFLGNIFLCDEGQNIMQNISKCDEIMKYCQKSMTSGNPHVITAAIQVLTNLMLET
jgi:hypothetical protein